MTDTFRNFIDGQLVESQSGKTFPDVNPADTREVVGLFPSSGPEEIALACDAAARAFPAWSATPAPKRGEFLFRAADRLESRLESLAVEMTREEGKTLPESRAEVRRTLSILRYIGGEGARQFSHQIPSEREHVFAFTMRKPLGVVALITPWNFPAAIPAWKLAPALVAGNTVVLKPASLAPLSAWRIVEALHEVGLPRGVLNLVTGSGASVGRALAENRSVRAVSFTGSSEVGDGLYRALAPRRIRTQLEMGGKNPTIVLGDANVDAAVEILVNGAFFSTGQKCTACSRAIVEGAIYEPLLEKLIARTRALKVGSGLEPGIEIGPAVDAKQLETDLAYVEVALREGAHLACGGSRLQGAAFEHGFFMEPTVFTHVSSEMRIAQEEVFGPVLAVMPADGFDDAIRLANATRFGLSASIVSNDLSKVHAFIDRIEAGLITVNLPTAGVEYQLPFGGTKESSFGPREQGPNALEFYTGTRTVYLKH